MEVHQREDVIREPCRVGVVFPDAQVGFVIQQAVEHVGRIAHADIHDLVERRVLVGDMGIERPSRAAAVFRIDGPVLSALLPVRKFWPSDDDVVPSPQCSAKGWRNCALTSFASAAPWVFRRGCARLAASQQAWSFRGRTRPFWSSPG